MSPLLFWSMFASVSISLELIARTFYFLVAGMLALGAAGIIYAFGFNAPFFWQLGLFTTLCLAIWFAMFLLRQPVPVVASEDIGMRVPVLELTPSGGQTRVRYRGQEWDAQVEPCSGIAQAGQVSVVGVKGHTLLCRAISAPQP